MIRSLSLTGEPIAVTGRRTAALTSGRIDGGAAARKIQFSDALSRMTADVDEFFFVVFVFFFSVFFVFFAVPASHPIRLSGRHLVLIRPFFLLTDRPAMALSVKGRVLSGVVSV